MQNCQICLDVFSHLWSQLLALIALRVGTGAHLSIKFITLALSYLVTVVVSLRICPF